MSDQTPADTLWARARRARIGDRLAFFVLLALLAAVLLPMLVIAAYDVPCADDFSYGSSTHRVWVETHSLPAVLSKAAWVVDNYYHGWQGTFSATFLFSLQPAVFSARLYWVTPVLMLLSLCGGLCCLTGALRRALGATVWQGGIAAIVLIAAWTQLLPSPCEAFYWFNGSSYYTFFFGLSLILYGQLADVILDPDQSRSTARRILRLVGMTALCVLLGGSNYTTALTAALLMAGGLLASVLRRRWRDLTLLIPFGALVAALLVNAAAPGNAVRQAQYADHPSAMEAVLRSFATAREYICRWTSPLLLCLLVFLIPLLYRMAKASRYSFRLPLLFVAGSYCLISAMFCPPVYAMGTPGPDRLHDIIFFAYVLLLAADLLYCLGWLARRLEKRQSAPAEGRPKGALPVLFTAAVACLFLAALMCSTRHITSRSALGSLVRGEAAAYHAEFEERLALLEDDTAQDVTLEPYSVKPYVLYFGDISTDPADWMNQAMCNYFDKQSVALSR